MFRYHLVGHIARTTAEIPSGPQVSSPELFLDVRKLRHQFVRRLPFEPLQQPTDRYLRRDRHEQMDVVLPHVPFHDLHLMLPADVSNQIPRSRRHLSGQSWPSILRNPHQMQMDLEYGMRAVAIFWHPPA